MSEVADEQDDYLQVLVIEISSKVICYMFFCEYILFGLCYVIMLDCCYGNAECWKVKMPQNVLFLEVFGPEAAQGSLKRMYLLFS